VNVALGAAFLAGLASIASPCVFPLLPVYLGYLAGDDVAGVGGRGAGGRLLGHSAAFVLGFSLLFVALGATATALGALIARESVLFERLGGLVIVLFGLGLLGVVRLPGLGRTVAVRPRRRPGAGGAFLLGLAFAAGWTPCVGPILATILIIAGQVHEALRGAVLLAAYSAGLGVPFLLLAAAAGLAAARVPRLDRYLPWAERAGGALLVALGAVMGLGLFGRLVGATG
jgi:cytochrome c-type biogenesis protein